jgi:hypothetical protein
MAEMQHIHPTGAHPPVKVRVIRSFVWGGLQHPVGAVLELPMHDARMLRQDSKVEPIDAEAPILPAMADKADKADKVVKAGKTD